MRKQRLTLVGLELLMGTVAIACGVILATGNAKSILGMDDDQLNGTPFHSYVIPGITLAVAVGGSQSLAALGLLRRTPWAEVTAFSAGAMLMGWIAGQVVFIGWDGPWWQQPLYVLYGISSSVLAWRIAGTKSLRDELRLAMHHLTQA